MQINLSSIGMEKGKQYETIITTTNPDNTKNAAPIGILYAGGNQVLCRIFKGGKTLDNILRQKEFTANITKNPELFTTSLLGNLPQNYFNDDNTIKDIEAYFKCEAYDFKEAVKQSDPIKKSGEAIVFKSKVKELVINKEIKAYNRAFDYVVESLANLTRFDLVDDETREFYIKQFREARRVVNKVGYKKEKEAMDQIKKELRKKGYEP